MKIGIDKIGFAMPKYFLNIEDLAVSRGENPIKFTKGLLQKEMSVATINEDIISLGASAAYEILDETDKQKIDMIIFATESSIDQSKASSVFIHGLLNIQPYARSIEIKEACYGATAALNYAKNYILNNPESYVLVVASDIAKYGIGTSGESTQGAGSIAMLVKKDPNILILNNESLCQTRDIMDFWRPNYSSVPFVDGHYSSHQYLECLETTWNEFKKRNNNSLTDYKAFCFHLPFPKLGLKGLNLLLTIEKENITKEIKAEFISNFHSSIIYNQRVGNIYTGSLYLSLLSLLENSENLHSGDKVALFSYGSGAVCELFSVTLAENFKNNLYKNRISLFEKRKKIDVETYEKIFFDTLKLDENGNSITTFENDNDFNPFILKKVENHKRIYKKL